MKDRTLLFSVVIACGIHAIALALNIDLSRPSLASAAPTIEVALVAPSKPEPLPVLAGAGSPAPASAPKKVSGPARLQPGRPAKSASKPEPKPVQAAEPTLAPMPGPNPSFEPQPTNEPDSEVVVVEQAAPVVATASAATPGGRSGAPGGISGYGVVDAEGGGMPGGGGSGGYGAGAGGSTPAYAFNPKPVYPQAARREGQEGKALLLVEVLSNGRVGKVKIEKSSGYKILDEAAVEAVRKWRFTPARKGKTPVTAWARVPIEFSLTD